jgi:hypothetical protein
LGLLSVRRLLSDPQGLATRWLSVRLARFESPIASDSEAETFEPAPSIEIFFNEGPR